MSYSKTAFQVLVSGMKGQGKTTLTDAIATGRKRIFVFDMLGEYAAKGFVEVRTYWEFMKCIRRGWKRGFKIAYVPFKPIKGQDDTTYPAQLSQLAEIICSVQMPYKTTPDNGPTPPIPKVLFIVEEMKWSYPQGANCPGMGEICSLGRHYGIDVIGTTQRIAEVSTNFRGNCDVRYFFAQEEHTDITTIVKMIGPKNRDQLTGLAPHEYLRLFRGQLTKGKNRLKR